jgi:chromosome segregation ATPase
VRLLQGRFTRTDTGLLDRTHLQFFDRCGIDELFADSNLRMLDVIRVTRQLGETELEVAADEVPADVLRAATADLDSHTYQFVLVASRDDGSGVPRSEMLAGCLQDRLTGIERGWRDVEGYVRKLEADTANHVRDITNRDALIVQLRASADAASVRTAELLRDLEASRAAQQGLVRVVDSLREERQAGDVVRQELAAQRAVLAELDKRHAEYVARTDSVGRDAAASAVQAAASLQELHAEVQRLLREGSETAKDVEAERRQYALHIDQLTGELRGLRHASEEAERRAALQYGEEASRASALSAEVDRLRTAAARAHEEWEAERAAYRDEIDRWRTAVDAADRARRERVDAESTQSAASIAQLIASFGRLEANRVEERARSEADRARLTQRLDELGVECQRTRSAAIAAKETAAYLRRDLEIKEAYIASLRQREMELEHVQEDARRARDAMAASQSDLFRLQAELDAVQTQLGGAREQLAVLGETHAAFLRVPKTPRYWMADRLNGMVKRSPFVHRSLRRAFVRFTGVNAGDAV